MKKSMNSGDLKFDHGHFRSGFVATVFFLLIALTVSAQGLINFDSATNLTSTYYGTTYVESGVRFISTGGSMSTWYGQGSNIPVSPTRYLVFNTSTGKCWIDLANGQPFGLLSVDLADPQISSSISPEIVFRGFKADRSVVTNRFTTPGMGWKAFGSFPFTSEFGSGLTNVEVSARFAMDNLRVVTSGTTSGGGQPPALPSFKYVFRNLGPTNIQALATGDFNGDGKVDAVISVLGAVRFYYGIGDGTLSDPVDYPGATNSYYSWLVTGDFNNDNRLDLVASRQNEVASFINRPTGGFTVSTQSYFSGDYPPRTVSADFNQDGRDDIAIASSLGALIAFSTGDGHFTFQTNLFTSARDVAAADFNEDGLIDIAVSSDYGLGIFANGGNGTFVLSQNYSSYGNTALILADFNNDSHLDLAVSVPGGSATVRLNNGQSFWSAKSYSSYSYPNSYGGAAADFNGDGKLDIVLNWNPYAFLLGRDDGFYVYRSFQNMGNFKAADFDGDGLQDILTSSGNYLMVLLNTTPPPMRLSPGPGYNQISWPSAFGDAYTVEYSVDPLDSRSWKPFPYPPVLFGTERAIADWADAPQKFYRLSKPTRQ